MHHKYNINLLMKVESTLSVVVTSLVNECIRLDWYIATTLELSIITVNLDYAHLSVVMEVQLTDPN
jgi:hypothetical protein